MYRFFNLDGHHFLTILALAVLPEQAEKRAELTEAENARLKELLRQADITQTGASWGQGKRIVV